MRSSDFIKFKLSAKSLIICYLIMLSLLLVFVLVKQNREIKSLQSETNYNKSVITRLKATVSYLQDENSDAENLLNQLQSEIDDLKENSHYHTSYTYTTY